MSLPSFSHHQDTKCLESRWYGSERRCLHYLTEEEDLTYLQRQRSSGTDKVGDFISDAAAHLAELSDS